MRLRACCRVVAATAANRVRVRTMLEFERLASPFGEQAGPTDRREGNHSG